MNKFLSLLFRRAVLMVLVVAAISHTTAVAQSQPPANAATAQLKLKLTGHTKSIVEIAFSPDGETIATGSEDGTVRLWDARDGRERATLKLTKRLEWLLLVWSPDSRRLATCWYRGFGNTKDVRIWDARTGALLTTLAGHGSAVNHVEWSPDGQTILTSSDDGTAKLWDGATPWGLRRTIVYEQVDVSRETDSILAAVFTRKKMPALRNVRAHFAGGGRTVVVSSYNQPPQLWSIDGQLIAPLITRAERLAQANSDYPFYSTPLLSPDGRFAATTDRDAVQVWDARTGQLRHTLDGESAHLFSPDGRTLITAAWKERLNMGFFDFPDVVLKLRDVETGEVRKSLQGAVSSVNRIYLSPAGERLVVNGAGKMKARLLDPHTGASKARLPYEGCSETLFGDGSHGCEPFIFSADGRVTLKLTGTLKLFDAETGQQLAVLDDTHRRAAFSPVDARLLAARSKDRKSLLLFEVAAR